MSAFDDYFARMMPDVEQWAAQFAAEPVAGRPVVVPLGDPVNPFSRAALDARKIVSYIDVPDELLMTDGLIPDTRPKPPPLPWRTRLRWRIRDARERAAERAYRLICGHDVPDYEE